MKKGAIDIWANWWPSEFFRASPDLTRLYQRLGFQHRMSLGGEDILDEACAADVRQILISATAFPGSPATNDAVAEVAASDARLMPCASVDPRNGMSAVLELRRAVEVLGCRALKLLPYLYERPPNDRIYYPLYAACIDLGIPALILTGHTAVLQSSEPGRPGALDDVALYFPQLTIVAGHAGYPWTQEMISLAWKHENVFIDTSGHRPRYFPPELIHFLNSFGRSKVVFGTGYPLMDFATPLAEVEALGLKEKARDAFLYGNAARVLRLDGGELS